MLKEGEIGLAVRKDQRGLYSVIECTVKTGFHGTRRYGQTVGTIKYKTEAGAKKALKRWATVLYYKDYKDLGTIDNTIFVGEEVK